MRSEKSKQQILSANAKYASQLDFAIVPDVATPGAFDEAVKAEPGLDYVLHTASPFILEAKDVAKGACSVGLPGQMQTV